MVFFAIGLHAHCCLTKCPILFLDCSLLWALGTNVSLLSAAIACLVLSYLCKACFFWSILLTFRLHSSWTETISSCSVPHYCRICDCLVYLLQQVLSWGIGCSALRTATLIRSSRYPGYLARSLFWISKYAIHLLKAPSFIFCCRFWSVSS
jgi:hypothetical protein